MKIASFLLLLAGWGLVLAALAMLPPGVEQNIFVLAAILVELLGLGLAIRTQRFPRRERG